MKKRFALAVALAVSIIPFAYIEEAKTETYADVEARLERLRFGDPKNKNKRFLLYITCVKKKFEKKKSKNLIFPKLILEKKDYEYIIRLSPGKRLVKNEVAGFYRAKEAYLNQYKKRCISTSRMDYDKYRQK